MWYSLESDLVEWFPEFHPDGWGPAQATPVSVGAASPVAGLSATLARAARLGFDGQGARPGPPTWRPATASSTRPPA